jgi:hypothetical protein
MEQHTNYHKIRSEILTGLMNKSEENKYQQINEANNISPFQNAFVVTRDEHNLLFQSNRTSFTIDKIETNDIGI